MAIQATQIVASDGLHEVDERLAAWLLMCADPIESNSIPLQHGFLRLALGTLHSNVTGSAATLEKAVDRSQP